jgi:hypothetical protein
VKKRCHEINVAVLVLLMTRHYTRAELLKAIGTSSRSLYDLVEEMHDKCAVYIHSWTEVGNVKGKRPIPRYALQPSVGHFEDAPRPEAPWLQRKVIRTEVRAS